MVPDSTRDAADLTAPEALSAAPPRVWLRRLTAAIVGAVTLLGLGQISSLAGGTCMILCNPPVAALYGALLGAFVVGNGKR